MSESIAMTDAEAQKSAKKKARWVFFLNQLPYVILYATTIVLVAMTDREPTDVAMKWIWFIPAVALVAIFGGWKYHAGESAKSRVFYLFRQVLHWAALAVVVHYFFTKDLLHFLNAETDGVVMIFLLGLTAILSGIHADWKMGLFGAFLIMSGETIGWFDDNAVLMGIVGGAAAVAVILTLLVRSRVTSRKKTKSDAAGGIEANASA
ncbi:hypothetical protein [Thiorhodovibrio frisius]|uniref:Uncharacterized protein n=1 Tax=Thiorhodovibrio frisius TaxID=631362 RepID=H8Z621_9GAMM|nr:hypothetical protein [Thiorhodovibrio frisius]EIC20671.1 hypothetical protein Thi970DRAFT_04325 [Thiorhodovibrio frisius]WPL21419.1 hypothetical protein Thiofri_01544 [Thiorhodovibrio frisius]